jgi:hypothetical protein
MKAGRGEPAWAVLCLFYVEVGDANFVGILEMLSVVTNYCREPRRPLKGRPGRATREINEL